MNRIYSLFLLLCLAIQAWSQTDGRATISLNHSWYTMANDSNPHAYDGFENTDFPVKNWIYTDIPHNWDQYHGCRRMVHGNRHGYAWYRKEFSVDIKDTSKRYFLFFEGVSSYATVWLNGELAGTHAGGRTTFTLDVTDDIHLENKPNILAVRADHPAYIRDLPWVCGGCSKEWGFSEGSQPMGIFRPVSLLITGQVKFEPFGVHIWNDTTVNESSAKININTEIKNFSTKPNNISIVHRIIDPSGNQILQLKRDTIIGSNELMTARHTDIDIPNPNLWSPANPYLYALESEIVEAGFSIDRVSNSFGIRKISWPIYRNDGDHRFYINGEPFFINGTAAYEHMLGQSHAFSAPQIKARVMQIKAAGFNAFRDAHQPHNMRYQHYWDSLGILFWPQMAAHIWFDNDSFKTNFRQLLRG